METITRGAKVRCGDTREHGARYLGALEVDMSVSPEDDASPVSLTLRMGERPELEYGAFPTREEVPHDQVVAFRDLPIPVRKYLYSAARSVQLEAYELAIGGDYADDEPLPQEALDAIHAGMAVSESFRATLDLSERLRAGLDAKPVRVPDEGPVAAELRERLEYAGYPVTDSSCTCSTYSLESVFSDEGARKLWAVAEDAVREQAA